MGVAKITTDTKHLSTSLWEVDKWKQRIYIMPLYICIFGYNMASIGSMTGGLMLSCKVPEPTVQIV